MAEEQEWTVHELQVELSKFNVDRRVKLRDADTNMVIPKFTVEQCGDDVFIFPCDYEDMTVL